AVGQAARSARTGGTRATEDDACGWFAALRRPRGRGWVSHLALGVLLFAGGFCLRPAALGGRLAFALGLLALVSLALDLLAFLALDFLGLGLRLLRRRADRRENGLGIVE